MQGFSNASFAIRGPVPWPTGPRRQRPTDRTESVVVGSARLWRAVFGVSPNTSAPPRPPHSPVPDPSTAETRRRDGDASPRDAGARAPVKATIQRGGSPRQADVHPPVTEGYCVVATRGGELPKVNNPSVTTSPDEPETTSTRFGHADRRACERCAKPRPRPVGEELPLSPPGDRVHWLVVPSRTKR